MPSQSLQQRLCRSNEYDLLNSYINPTNHLAKNLIVYGFHSCGKSSLVLEVTKKNYQNAFCHVDMASLASDKELFDEILYQFFHEIIKTPRPKLGCLNFDGLLRKIDVLWKDSLSRCFVLDNISNDSFCDSPLFSKFSRVPEALNAQIVFVFNGFPSQFLLRHAHIPAIHFQSYSRQQLKEIIAREVRNANDSEINKSLSVYSMYTKNASKLKEIISFVLRNDENDRKLLEKSICQNFGLFDCSSSHSLMELRENSNGQKVLSKLPQKAFVYLLLSVFLASRIPAKSIAFFSYKKKFGQNRTKKRKVVISKTKPPHYSSLESVEIIYNFIRDNYGNGTAGGMKRRVRFNMMRVFEENGLVRMDRRGHIVCEANYETAKEAAQSIDFPLEEFFE